MAASMSLVGVGRHSGLQQSFWTMVQWMATRYLGQFTNHLMDETDIAFNASQRTWGVSHTWQWWRIEIGAPSHTRQQWKCTPWCTSSANGRAIFASSWPSSSFEVVANKLLRGSCAYIPQGWRNGKWWTHRNAAQIPGFTISLCICNDTQSGRDRPKSYSCKPCSNYSEVLGIEWAAAGISTSCPARAKQSTTHMDTDYGSWWLW